MFTECPLQGNVAVDVARVLLRDPSGGVLPHTDIAAHALNELEASNVTKVTHCSLNVRLMFA